MKRYELTEGIMSEIIDECEDGFLQVGSWGKKGLRLLVLIVSVCVAGVAAWIIASSMTKLILEVVHWLDGIPYVAAFLIGAFLCLLPIALLIVGFVTMRRHFYVTFRLWMRDPCRDRIIVPDAIRQRRIVTFNNT